MDLYKTLGVDTDATQAEVKRAFRTLTLQCHPDKNPGDKAAEERFKDISEAYEVLGDEDRRKKYDRLPPDADGATNTVDLVTLLNQRYSTQGTDLFTLYTERLERIKNLDIPDEVAQERDEQVAKAKKQGDKWIAEAEKKIKSEAKNARKFEGAERNEFQRQLREIRRDAQHRAREYVNKQRTLARERAYEETQLRLTPQERTELARRVKVAVDRQRDWKESSSSWVAAIKIWRNTHILKIVAVFLASAWVFPLIPYVGTSLSIVGLLGGFFSLIPGVFFAVFNVALVGIRSMKRRKSLSDAIDPQEA